MVLGFGMFVQPRQNLFGPDEGSKFALLAAGRRMERQEAGQVVRQAVRFGSHADSTVRLVVDAVQGLFQLLHALEEESVPAFQFENGKQLAVEVGSLKRSRPSCLHSGQMPARLAEVEPSL